MEFVNHLMLEDKTDWLVKLHISGTGSATPNRQSCSHLRYFIIFQDDTIRSSTWSRWFQTRQEFHYFCVSFVVARSVCFGWIMRVFGKAVLAQIVQTAVIDFAVKMVIVVELWTLGNRTVLPTVCYIWRCVISLSLLYRSVCITEWCSLYWDASVDIGWPYSATDSILLMEICFVFQFVLLTSDSIHCINPYPTAFPYGNGMVLHFYQQQESSTTKTVHKVINKGLKTYV